MRITKHYFIIKSIFDFESQNLPFLGQRIDLLLTSLSLQKPFFFLTTDTCA